MHALFWLLWAFVTSPDGVMPPRHRKGISTLASLLLPETCSILTHMHTLYLPVLLVFSLIPLVNMLIHQPVITRLYSHSTLPLQTPMFQSLRRPRRIQHPASKLSTCRRLPFMCLIVVEQPQAQAVHTQRCISLLEDTLSKAFNHVQQGFDRIVLPSIHPHWVPTSYFRGFLSSLIFLSLLTLAYSSPSLPSSPG